MVEPVAGGHARLGQVSHLRQAQGGQTGPQQGGVERRLRLGRFGRAVVRFLGEVGAAGRHHAGAACFCFGLVQQEVLDGCAEGGVFGQVVPAVGAGREDAPGGAFAEVVGQAQVGTLRELPFFVLRVFE
ncbi:hypothetical protein OHB06_01320 [Streptomyces sp. NBC_01604]|uniref:hypothetical protein n=1 Tax=Streptomyces sp. NBC_01604 TaxID=2975894 RepID=UPI003865A343